MRVKLAISAESLGNVERSKKHTDHGTWIGKLIDPRVAASLGALAKGV